MPWNGYRGHESDVGDGWDVIENCSLYIKNECRRRLGFGARVDISGDIIIGGGEISGKAVVAASNGDISSITESSGSVASLGTVTVTSKPSFASMNNRLYFSLGGTVRASDDGTSYRNAGIAAPTVDPVATPAAGGVVTEGDHLIRYRYYDSTRKRLSNPSDAVTVTIVAGTQSIDVDVTASADSTVDQILIEMTPAGASTYYRVLNVVNVTGTYIVNEADDTLIVLVAASRDGEFGHEPPQSTSGNFIAEHRQRLWQIVPSTNLLLWSRALFPESWDAINYSRTLSLDNGDTPSAMCSFYSDLYIIGQRSMRRMVYTSDPAAAMIVDVPGNFGCFNNQCVLKIDGGLMIGWGRNGAWIIDAMQPKKISQPVDDVIASLGSTATTNRFIAYEPTRREVYFFLPMAGDTYAKTALVWSLDTGEWVRYIYRQPISYAMIHSSYNTGAVLAVHDSNGYAWRVGEAANDGGGDGVVTVTSGSTTTVINGTNTAVAGQTAYLPSTGEERLITVASGSQITVSPALSAAPTAGTEVYIGSIRQRVMTDWLPMDSMAEKKRPTKLLMAVRPEGDMGKATVNYYQDFGSTAVTATSFSVDQFPDGVTIPGDEIIVDLDIGAQDGFIPVPTPADWKRVLRTEVIAETPLDGVRFLEVTFKENKGIDEDRE